MLIIADRIEKQLINKRQRALYVATDATEQNLPQPVKN